MQLSQTAASKIKKFPILQYKFESKNTFKYYKKEIYDGEIRNPKHSNYHTQTAAHDGRFVQEDMVIDYDRRNVTISGEEVHLTQTEFNILAYLSRHVGKVVTYSTIIGAIWGGMDSGSIKKLQVNMANIRKKLGCTPGENKYFINELGVGYRMLDARE